MTSTANQQNRSSFEESPMIYSRPKTEIIKNRFSCRTFLVDPISTEKQRLLRDIISSLAVGPFGTVVREEKLPAVVALGLIADEARSRQTARQPDLPVDLPARPGINGRLPRGKSGRLAASDRISEAGQGIPSASLFPSEVIVAKKS